MKEAIKKKWIEALRSGEYEQRKGQLLKDGKYCCLGVLAKIQGWLEEDENGEGFVLQSALSPYYKSIPYTKSERIDLSNSTQSALAYMNDYGGKNFNEIADYIEKHL